MCLNQNAENWPDVFSCFDFKITHSTTCLACSNEHSTETLQMYVELEVPKDKSNLNVCVEEYFNTSSLCEIFCEECNKLVEKEKRSTLRSTSEAQFIIIILTRAVETFD